MAVRKTTDLIVLHCSATRPSMDVGAKEIDKWHKARGWLKIGYQRVIRRNGDVEQGRKDDEIGAHAEGYNSHSIGVCWVGGVAEDSLGPEDNRTDAQRKSLESVVRELKQKYPGAKVVGHGDLPGVHKACPSFSVANWLKEINL